MGKIIEVVLGGHSPISRKIISFREIKDFPEGIQVLDNVAVLIENDLFLDSASDRDCDDNEFVEKISSDGHLIELNEGNYFKFRTLIRENKAFLYDFCGEIPDLGLGKYIKE